MELSPDDRRAARDSAVSAYLRWVLISAHMGNVSSSRIANAKRESVSESRLLTPIAEVEVLVIGMLSACRSLLPAAQQPKEVIKKT